MSSRRLFLLLHEPVLLHGRSLALGLSALQFYLLRLVRLQLACDVGLLGRCRCLGDNELLDMAFGVGCLQRRRLVVPQLPEVKVLHDIGWSTSGHVKSGLRRAIEVKSPWRTAVGTMKEPSMANGTMGITEALMDCASMVSDICNCCLHIPHPPPPPRLRPPHCEGSECPGSKVLRGKPSTQVIMSYAPDGRLLSPGEVYEPATPAEPKEEEWREKLDVILICPDCRSDPPVLVEEFSSGDTVCGECGRVLAERLIDTRSEWRTFSNDDQGNDDPSRVGDAANPLLHGSQLSTEIAFDGGHRVRELARAQNKATHDKTNKNLQAAYSQITQFVETAGITKVIGETAKILFKKQDEAKILKGKPMDAIIAGCIFIACRQHQAPRSFREIFKLTRVSKKEIGRTFKVLETYLSKEIREQEKKMTNGGQLSGFKHTKSTDASELILRACNNLGLPASVGITAQEAAVRVADLGVAAGRSPLSITGACIYLVAHLMGHPTSPKEIGQAVDVSDGTIRTAYKLLYQAVDKIIDDSWLPRGADRSRIPPA
ncbi:cyclin-like protein [Westerdykella ornata]|uniref:Transcription initiation factor IIB n=1 Tax=Westerdykella ornata TaxID=318751 RepID=A0A6A6JER9_WESOR|nr:cyclin-like protein [Westerdykella ornata]KAF2274126.1 cyclin-like protein [Westerdykella ornata]